MLAEKQPARQGGQASCCRGQLRWLASFSPNCYFPFFIHFHLSAFGFPERAEWDPESQACLEKRDPFPFFFYTLHLIERKPTVPPSWPTGWLWVGTWNCLTYTRPIPPPWVHTYLWKYIATHSYSHLHHMDDEWNIHLPLLNDLWLLLDFELVKYQILLNNKTLANVSI